MNHTRHKQNCWEYLKCGREPSGTLVEKFGVCPVSVETRAHTLNDGINGGRICWVVNETIHRNACARRSSCDSCPFRALVMKEEDLKGICLTTGTLLFETQQRTLASPAGRA